MCVCVCVCVCIGECIFMHTLIFWGGCFAILSRWNIEEPVKVNEYNDKANDHEEWTESG